MKADRPPAILNTSKVRSSSEFLPTVASQHLSNSSTIKFSISSRQHHPFEKFDATDIQLCKFPAALAALIQLRVCLLSSLEVIDGTQSSQNHQVMQMHDLEDNRGRDAAEDATSEPPFLSLDGTTEPKSRADPLQAIAWMIVNTLATVGIASNPQNIPDANMYV